VIPSTPAAGRADHSMARPPQRAASCVARVHVRLATSSDPVSMAPASACAMASPISPAPSTRVVFPANDPSSAPATATATCDSEVVPRAMAVSERTRLPTSSAWRNRVASTGPIMPSTRAASQASPTWPRISPSPSTAESSPAATLNRWAAAASS